MQDIKRQDEILNYLKSNNSATVEFLAKKYYASPSTIRRDLTLLEKTGLVHRTHGGVIYNDRFKELSIMIRKNKNEGVKDSLAQVAAKYMPEFTSVFIDNSSTCASLIKYLNLDKKIVVTNSVYILHEVKTLYDAHVILIGGDYDIENMSTSGPLTFQNLNKFHFDLFIQSCTYVDSKGTYESEQVTAMVKKSAMEQSDHKVLIFDKSKLEKSATCKTAQLNEYDLIVTDADENQKNKLKQLNPNLVLRSE